MVMDHQAVMAAATTVASDGGGGAGLKFVGYSIKLFAIDLFTKKDN